MKKLISAALVLAATVALVGCGQKNEPVPGTVKPGVEVLRDRDFAPLKGKRVGLITNPTGVDRQLNSTIDILAGAPDVKLVALYSPEHGVRGDIYAGDKVEDYTDPRTGVPVYSLYGKHRKPTPEMLKDVDVLVYDIQDIGSRSYTFISTLGVTMEAAAENGKEFVVLDRPNPLGGLKMEGMLTEPEFVSFVSQFPIPYIHGLTVGELASYLNGEGLLTDSLDRPVKADLTVVPMEGWKRDMTFDETGLPWVMSSPHIPQYESAVFYPVSGILGELYSFNIGIGYTLPFQVFGAEWITEPERLADSLNAQGIPGIRFRPIYYKPYYGAQKDQHVKGVQAHITDYEAAPLTLVQYYVLQECKKLYPEQDVFAGAEGRFRMFDQVNGSDKVRKAFTERYRVEDIEELWTKDIPGFRQRVQPYLLYQ